MDYERQTEWEGDYEVIRLGDYAKPVWQYGAQRKKREKKQRDWEEIEKKRYERQHKHQADVEFGYEDIDLMDDIVPEAVRETTITREKEPQADKSKNKTIEDKGVKLAKILELSRRLDIAEKEIVYLKEQMNKYMEELFL